MMAAASGHALPNLVMIGLQGSGKGTQAEILVETQQYWPIGVGQLLREQVEQATDLGRTLDRTLAQGQLVSDTLILDLINQQITGCASATPLVFDGYPRTANQAGQLEDLLRDHQRSLPLALYLEIREATVYQRLASRRSCSRCGKIQSAQPTAARSPTCPRCAGSLIARSDDQPQVIRQRLAIFYQETEPVLAWYSARGRLARINGEQPIATVAAAIARVLGGSHESTDQNGN